MVDGVSAVKKAHDLRIKLKVDEVSAVTGTARTKRQPHRLQNGHFRTFIHRGSKHALTYW
jgi:hypothetical protein